MLLVAICNKIAGQQWKSEALLYPGKEKIRTKNRKVTLKGYEVTTIKLRV